MIPRNPKDLALHSLGNSNRQASISIDLNGWRNHDSKSCGLQEFSQFRLSKCRNLGELSLENPTGRRYAHF